MKSNPNPCKKAYAQGIAERRSHPFVDGSKYKIRECYAHHRKDPVNLAAIGHRQSHSVDWPILLHCMPYEAQEWVEGYPARLCHSLAKDIQGAIPALFNDGVSQATVNKLALDVSKKASQFLVDAETARLGTVTNWSKTAAEMSHGAGPMYELALKFIAILFHVKVAANIS